MLLAATRKWVQAAHADMPAEERYRIADEALSRGLRVLVGRSEGSFSRDRLIGNSGVPPRAVRISSEYSVMPVLIVNGRAAVVFFTGPGLDYDDLPLSHAVFLDLPDPIVDWQGRLDTMWRQADDGAGHAL
jgi:hypothetical protein